jgi:hypothetical protein
MEEMMFYNNIGFTGEIQGETRAIVVLTPSESKRLIAKAVAMLPEVKKARQSGRMIISEGTTNAYVIEEIFGTLTPRETYACGIITNGWMSAVATEVRTMPYLLECGKPIDTRSVEEQRKKGEIKEESDWVHPKVNWELHAEFIKQFRADDVLIKGATAVDPWGNAGVFVAEGDGGSIGRDLPVIVSRGAHLIVPVGLEKLVPSVAQATKSCGSQRFKHAMGFCPGVMPLINGKVVTEIQALKILADVTTVQVGGGGVGGSEGAVVLAFGGEEDAVDRAYELVKSVKGEPPTPKPSLIPGIPPEMRFVRYFPF